MKSGLEGRNNLTPMNAVKLYQVVSMKSGLEGRNNRALLRGPWPVSTWSQ